jgi:hypothetical protein
MPKETTHWIVAEKVSQALAKTPYGPILKSHPNLLKFGAVFHDKLYYLPTKSYPKNEELRQAIHNIPSKLHGTKGEDTLAIIRQLCKNIQQQSNNEHLIAFMVGIITHIFTDVVWHPMVYHYTGNYYNPNTLQEYKAQANHLKLEAIFDLYFTKSFDKLKKNYSLQSYIANLEYPLVPLLAESCKGYTSIDLQLFTQYYEKAVKAAISSHTWIRRVSLNSFLQPISHYLPLKTQVLFSALYHNELYQYLEHLQGDITFKNPVTGTSKTTTMDKLLQEAVEECVRFCTSIEAIVFGTANPDFAEIGRSLEHGQIAGKVYNMSYFDYFFSR